MSDVEVFDDRVCLLGEGPHYDERTRRVVWVDILGSRVLWRCLDGSTGEITCPGHIGAAVPRRDGGLVLCLGDGPALLDLDGTLRELGTYAEAEAIAGGPPAPGGGLRSNDAKADPAGRLWLGTMAYDEAPGAGALYRLDPGVATPRRVLDDVTVSNGLGWSPDGTTMYYIDSPTGRIDRIGYDPATGELGRREVFVEIDTGRRDTALPDGLCVDAEGSVWVAMWQGGEVRRYAPDGRLDRVVALPTPRVTSCAFAGEGLDLLVVTTAALDRSASDVSAGLTFVHDPGDVVGQRVDRFAG
jgi:sugar lactone lactonase YvrE